MQNHRITLTVLWAIAAMLFEPVASACTNFLITKGASKDGSVMISYSADSHTLYGELYYRPARTFAKDSKLDIYEWDTGTYVGQISQVEKTFAVVGNMNEHQVAIGETTFTGRPELINPKGGIDYGSLMYVTLQRAKTAREAVRLMGSLAEEYGYRTEGETFSISDANEAWIMEMVGTGPESKGAVWVARRIPDGYVSAHANQSRLRQFPLHDPQNCLYSTNVISFARENGYFQGKDEEFSFMDAYAPMSYEGLRFCEARVWSMFRRVAPSQSFSLDYVKGVEGAKPLPLWIKPDKRLTVQDVMELMRDHFENSELDLSKGVGAGPFGLPYRWRPLVWELDGVSYINERSTSTQQTGFSFVTQSRAGLPDPIGGVLWFGVDDTYSTVYVPMYCGIQEAPKNYAVGTGDFYHFTWDSAFWVFNWVANFSYTRYSDIIQDIRKVQRDLEGGFLAAQPEIEKTALKLFQESPEQGRGYLTRYSRTQAENAVRRYRKLAEVLFVKYLDGNVRDEHGQVTHPPYPESWYRRIVTESGELYKKKKIKGELDEPTEPKVEPLAAGYFHSREELGPWAAKLPGEVSFEREKLLLITLTGRCGQPPQCCLLSQENSQKKEELEVLVPSPPQMKGPAFEKQRKCGDAGWLVRVPKGEKRPVVPRFEPKKENK